MEYSKARKIFTVGDIVCVKDNDLRATDRTFTATTDMHKMKGQRYTLRNISHSDRYDIACLSFGGFSWHADDVYVVQHTHEGPLVTEMAQKDVLKFDPSKI